MGADGKIHTFSRGGSDITGSIVAKAAKADMYENWTDVSGFLIADPRIIHNPQPIETITYRELRELSYMGATVLHEDAIFSGEKRRNSDQYPQYQCTARSWYDDRGKYLPSV